MSTYHGVFLLLPQGQQVALARTEGTYLGWRWEAESVLAGLYHMPQGFFCEVLYSLTEMTVLTLHTCTEPANLAAYAEEVDLHELLS